MWLPAQSPNAGQTPIASPRCWAPEDYAHRIWSLKLSSVLFLLSKGDGNIHNSRHNPVSSSQRTVVTSLEKAESSSPRETSRDQRLVTALRMSTGCGVSRFGVSFFKNSIGVYPHSISHSQQFLHYQWIILMGKLSTLMVATTS